MSKNHIQIKYNYLSLFSPTGLKFEINHNLTDLTEAKKILKKYISRLDPNAGWDGRQQAKLAEYEINLYYDPSSDQFSITENTNNRTFTECLIIDAHARI